MVPRYTHWRNGVQCSIADFPCEVRMIRDLEAGFVACSGDRLVSGTQPHDAFTDSYGHTVASRLATRLPLLTYQRGTTKATSAAVPSSSPAQLPITCSTAMADVGNFSEIRWATAVSVPGAPASPSATLDIAGSCPITSRVRTSSATELMVAMTVPGIAA